jgi:hypothetical protein
MHQENIITFYKQVEDIEALNKKDISGNLKEYFSPITQGNKEIIWIKNIGHTIKDQVEQVAIRYLK